MKPKVTIGVCVRNNAFTIREAIESIIEQDYPHELVELIVVDGYSEDKTLPIIKESLENSNIKSKIFNENKGLGYARQIVVDNAEGRYIVWVDGDMSLSRDFVRKQVEFMDRNPDVGIGKGRYGIHHTTSLVAYLENIEAVVEFLNCEQKTLSKPLGTGGSIYRVEAIRKVGGFDENIKGVGEDMDVEYRIRTSGWLLQTTTAEFYEKQRENWKDLWNEYFWHGSGGRTVFNKVSPHSMLYKMFPPTIILTVISRSCNAYKLTHKKVVFLLPLHWIFKRIAWCLGFAMGM